MFLLECYDVGGDSSLVLLSLLKMALAGEHSSYKGDFFALGKRCFLKAFCFLKALRKLFRFVILVINWNFQIIKQSDLVEGELYVANVCFFVADGYFIHW